jgi:virginiamycin B lyase
MRMRFSSRLLAAGVVLALGATASTAVAHEPTVTEFTTGLTSNSGPWGIVDGPSDKLWFTENKLDALGSLTADTNVFTELTGLGTVGGGRGIAKGPDGNLWVALAGGGGRIARITPSGTVTEFPAHEDPMLSTFPVDITAGPDGNLWFAERLANRIGRITPAGAVTELACIPSAGSGPTSIAAGSDGRVWFTQTAAGKVAALAIP